MKILTDQVCCTCKKLKDISEFYKHWRDGYQYRCKECQRANDRIRNATPERQEYNRLIQRKMYPNRRRQYWSKPEIKERRNELAKKYRKDPKNFKKYKARSVSKIALKNGTIKKHPCGKCGNKKSEMHHENYDKPLDITWLCRRCHSQRHLELKAKGA